MKLYSWLLTIDKLNVGIEKFNISLTTYNTGEKEPSKNRIKSVLFLHHPYTRCDVLRGEATNFVLLVCSQSSWYLGEQRQGRQRIINSILTTDQCSGSEQWFWKWWQLCSSFSAWASSRPESRLPADTARQPTCAATEVNILRIVDTEPPWMTSDINQRRETSNYLNRFVVYLK